MYLSTFQIMLELCIFQDDASAKLHTVHVHSPLLLKTKRNLLDTIILHLPWDYFSACIVPIPFFFLFLHSCITHPGNVLSWALSRYLPYNWILYTLIQTGIRKDSGIGTCYFCCYQIIRIWSRTIQITQDVVVRNCRPFLQVSKSYTSSFCTREFGRDDIVLQARHSSPISTSS